MYAASIIIPSCGGCGASNIRSVIISFCSFSSLLQEQSKRQTAIVIINKYFIFYPFNGLTHFAIEFHRDRRMASITCTAIFVLGCKYNRYKSNDNGKFEKK
jgi:hypothetical protein